MAKAKTEAPVSDSVNEMLPAASADVAPVQNEAPAPVSEEAGGAQLIRARVLAQCDLGAPNDVIDVPPQLAKDRADVLDTDPAAVAYALSAQS